MTDHDVLRELDFPTPCEATTEGCPNQAVSYGTCTHCGFTAPACSQHRTLTVYTLFLAALGRANLHCPTCKTPIRHVDSIRFEPIGAHP